MGEAAENIYDDIRSTVTKILKIYHAYKVLNDIDDQLAVEMNELVLSCKSATDMYNQMHSEDPAKLHPYAGHINALIKLTPALNMCVKDHNDLVQERLSVLDTLTEALTRIEGIMKKGFVTISQAELRTYHEEEKARLEKLRGSLPEMEKQHNMMRKRFETIKKELTKYDSPE